MVDLTLDQLSVLLIEPSTTQRRIIEDYLKTYGVSRISSVSTGHEAFASMKTYVPDLVISTMYLEDMTGTELVQTMRNDSEFEKIPFMLISSETDYRYLDPIRQAGVIALLPKPFESEQLHKALCSTLDFLMPDELKIRSAIDVENLVVLIVDDSLTSRKHIARVLRNMGFENISEAKDGVEASQMVHENYYDLIVTDYNMPNMNGKELVEYVRNSSEQASIPILLVSSENDVDRLAAVQQAGVSAVCDKPFEPIYVRQLLEKILD